MAFVAAAPSGLLSYGVHSPLAYASHEIHAPVAFAAHEVHTPVVHVAQPLTYVAPVQAKVHYESRPVVVGHSTQILKPALGAPAAVAVAAPAVELVRAAPAVEVVESAPVLHAAHFATPYVHNVAIATPVVHAPAVVNLKAAIPAGDAPPPSELVQTEKVLAPVRAVSKITPEVTVQLPTKVNVEKVAVDVPVAAPYAHPVPVPVTTHHHVGVASHTHFSAPTFLTHAL